MDENQIKLIYYDPSKVGSLGGIDYLHQNINLKSRSKVADWLNTQRSYSLHKPVRKKFPTRSYTVPFSNYLWQADLNEMIPYANENNQNRYILTVIDVFSRFAMALPIKRKTAVDLQNAFEFLFKKFTPPIYLQTDRGKEFLNKNLSKVLKKFNVNHYSVTGLNKAAIVERFNRTLKMRMFRYFTQVGNHNWVDILPKLVASYNDSKHRSLNNTPNNVMKNKSTWWKIWKKQEEKAVKKKRGKTMLQIGDLVRLSKYKGTFEKGYESNWTDEIFVVESIDRRINPIMYVVKDQEQNLIEGKFYRLELQKISPLQNQWNIIDRVIRTTKNRALVTFKHDKKKHVWIDKSFIKKISNI